MVLFGYVVLTKLNTDFNFSVSMDIMLAFMLFNDIFD
jgi:hypothetical protein